MERGNGTQQPSVTSTTSLSGEESYFAVFSVKTLKLRAYNQLRVTNEVITSVKMP